jgi:hypothetical protein
LDCIVSEGREATITFSLLLAFALSVVYNDRLYRSSAPVRESAIPLATAADLADLACSLPLLPPAQLDEMALLRRITSQERGQAAWKMPGP